MLKKKKKHQTDLTHAGSVHILATASKITINSGMRGSVLCVDFISCRYIYWGVVVGKYSNFILNSFRNLFPIFPFWIYQFTVLLTVYLVNFPTAPTALAFFVLLTRLIQMGTQKYILTILIFSFS